MESRKRRKMTSKSVDGKYENAVSKTGIDVYNSLCGETAQSWLYQSVYMNYVKR